MEISKLSPLLCQTCLQV